MDPRYVFNTTVSYADVDRREVMLLRSVFALLQEGAIRQANQFNTGTRAMAGRGESWVLNRIAAQIQRYPRHEDALRVETWSSGIKGFRGYREFRVFCGDLLLLAASSLWLYVNVRTRTLQRVPADIAEGFPILAEPLAQPDIERVPMPVPAAGAPGIDISIRYSDVDANAHVNNTAYFDYLQTALAQAGLTTTPTSVLIKFAAEIPPEMPRVNVSVENRGADVAFGIGSGDNVFAHGAVR
jgi:medium-chain acyl-[acyl-carrier-protein] hydrolase